MTVEFLMHVFWCSKAGDNPLTCPVRDYSMLAARTDTAWYADDGSITCTGITFWCCISREVILAGVLCHVNSFD